MEKYARIMYKDLIKWVKYWKGEWYELLGSIYQQNPKLSSNPIDGDNIKFLPPAEGNKVIALAYNYKGLIGKRNNFDEPLFFFKSPTGLIGHNDYVIYPEFGNKVWIEVELAIVIGVFGKNISIEEADKYILGYTCGNDITCENILNRDWHLARSKGLDTFCPLGPYLVKNIDTNNLRIKSFINGQLKQDSTTADRVLNDRECVSLISKYVTLYPGDVILTGTPRGATDAIVKKNDKIEIEIDGVGMLINYVK